ncbi:MAG: hypothetical protein M1830_003625 [Pleopsidium flavum]|nr:MAG: hypothetical protein M1830_003625 [Pleopsidium flavum]
MVSDTEPLVNPNSQLQSYYASFESRIGYLLFLGDSRHFGYYPKDTYWPFPINGALRAMEERLLNRLNLPRGAEVLDAGCGVGHVAIYMAQNGLHVQAIDIVDLHVEKARRNIRAAGLDKAITVRKMDYHHLDAFAAESFDGVYTMETVVHATDPEGVLAEFFRVLRPGGSIVMHEYDHCNLETAPKDLADSMECVNKYAAMPTNTRFDHGVLQRMLEDAGFQDVVLKDLSENITPMLWLFFVLAYIPYLIIRFLGLEAWFVNTVAGVNAYRGVKAKVWRYVAVSARKPGERRDDIGVAGEGKKIQ